MPSRSQWEGQEHRECLQLVVQVGVSDTHLAMEGFCKELALYSQLVNKSPFIKKNNFLKQSPFIYKFSTSVYEH